MLHLQIYTQHCEIQHCFFLSEWPRAGQLQCNSLPLRKVHILQLCGGAMDGADPLTFGCAGLEGTEEQSCCKGKLSIRDNLHGGFHGE